MWQSITKKLGFTNGASNAIGKPDARSPRTTINDVGAPGNIPAEGLSPSRLARIRYDWTVWSGDQLALMERKWDDWATFYAQWLPSPPATGVNLGTNNGAIQKAFQRCGYDMFGVEYHAVIEDLHRYGCRGIQASFFNMPQIPDESFDFAIIDRALCTTPEISWNVDEGGAYTEKKRIPIATSFAGEDAATRDGPPFFDEPMRIVRTGGTLLVVFYTYVSKLWIRDLAAHGSLEILTDDRKRPYFICKIVKGASPTELPTLEEFLDNLLKTRDVSVATGSPYCRRVNESNGIMSFLYSPENRFVSVNLQTFQVISCEPYFVRSAALSAIDKH